MVRTIYFCLLFLFIFSTFVFAREESVGFFKTSSTDVHLLRADIEREVLVGMQVMVGDVVRTGPTDTAGIIFRDGTVITIGSDTEVEIRKYEFAPSVEKYEFFLFMKKGEVLYSSGKLGKLAPEKVNLQTPTATVGVYGARIILSAK